MTDIVDEVSYSDYRKACARLEVIAGLLPASDPDEAAEHYLPQATQAFALIFNFVGANMTARHVPRLNHTVAELEAAKDRASRPQQGDDSP